MQRQSKKRWRTELDSIVRVQCMNDDVNISPWRTLQVQPIWYRYALFHSARRPYCLLLLLLLQLVLPLCNRLLRDFINKNENKIYSILLLLLLLLHDMH